MYQDKTMKEYFYKLGGLENFLWAIVLFFAPIKGVLISVGAFILLDTISGIWRARVSRIPITSRGLSAIVSKMFLYQATVIVTYVLDFYMLGEIIDGISGIEQTLTKVVAVLLISIEAKSINENYKEAKGIDLWATFLGLISRTREITSDAKKIKDNTSSFSEHDDFDLPDFED